MTTTVGPSNQVVIPPEIAREYAIHPGTRLEWARAGGDTISVKPLPDRGEAARQLLGAGRRLLAAGSDPIAELIQERERDDRLDQVDQQP